MRATRQLRLAAVMGLTALGALPASAQPAPDKTAPEAVDLRRNGPYLGVAPGTRDASPSTARLRSQGAVRLLTWVGFQMVGTGGRVFIQATERPVYNLVPGGTDEVILEFPDTRLHSNNDARRLETGMFPTAVGWVEAQQLRGNVTRVTVKLRETVGYDLHQDGNYVLLDFRPPSPETLAPPPPPSDASPAPAP